MANNKVVLSNGTTLIDLTDATATADKILTGYTAYGADGTKLVGTASSGGSSTGPEWILIDTYSTTLTEYTNTSTWENNDTGIDVKSTDYAWFFIEITCDSAITTTTEWGMTLTLGGRYTSNSNFMYNQALQMKGVATMKKSEMVSNHYNGNNYGVTVGNNTSNIIFARKAHATAMPKIRGGVYTVNVYGLKSL